MGLEEVKSVGRFPALHKDEFFHPELAVAVLFLFLWRCYGI